MPEWRYNPARYAETRVVTVGQDADEMWRWRRNRTGPEGRQVAQSVSGGFDEAKWCYQNAVKENYPLPVPTPEGVEELTVTEVDRFEPLPDPSEEEVVEPVDPPQPAE